MGLSYYYTFSAPANVSPEELITFLKSVEIDAKKMGFRPTMVLNAVFDSQQRREFARRVVSGVSITDERLKGAVLCAPHWDFNPVLGFCRLAPQRAVILIVTDEQGCETVFGFARYPEELRDVNGRVLLTTPVGNRWFFRGWVKSPDPRYRKIVKRFVEKGCMEEARDEYEC